MSKFERTTFISLCSITAAILAILLFSRPAKAEDEFAVYEGMARQFVQEQTGWDMDPAGPVRFVMKSRQELAQIYYGNRDTERRDVQALYADGVVLLMDTFRLPRDSDVLVHEYVHHAVLQLGMKDDFECLGEEERKAYEIHNKWVDETGWGSKASPMWMLLLSCRPDMQYR